MSRMIFVNLPVTDLDASRRFYTALGFTVEHTYSDDSCACIVVSDTIFVMLLVHSRFADFIDTRIADARSTTQVLNCLSADSRDEVDALVARATAHGGTARGVIEAGPMYGSSVADPDGHVWEFLHMAADGEQGAPEPARQDRQPSAVGA